MLSSLLSLYIFTINMRKDFIPVWLPWLRILCQVAIRTYEPDMTQMLVSVLSQAAAIDRYQTSLDGRYLIPLHLRTCFNDVTLRNR